jgi:hypothetical protein
MLTDACTRSREILERMDSRQVVEEYSNCRRVIHKQITCVEGGMKRVTEGSILISMMTR